jgi:MSHA biogenesis protein MshL
MTIAVNDADLRDILRAATTETNLNLIFEPGLDTRVQGLNLKGMGLQEILDDVLPRLGMFCTRTGRNLYIQKSDENLRFYHVDLLAMARNGTKTFQVNASGQAVQGGGTGTSNSSAYTSTVQVGLGNDPWAELENGLMLLVFGKPVDRPASGAGGNLPMSRGFSADGKSLLIEPGSGVVMVQGGPAIQKRVELFLKETQQRGQRQVQLEARIVEVTLDNDSQMGVNWNSLLSRSGPKSSLTTTANSNANLAGGLLTLVAQSGRVQAVLTALAADDRLKVLSSPRLSTLNNQKAILRVVTEQPFFSITSQVTPGSGFGGDIKTETVTSTIVPNGIILDIQPQIGDDGNITLAVNPSVSQIVDTLSAVSLLNAGGILASLPVVNRRDLDAIVRVKSGDTLVLAGIIQTKENTSNTGVPWLRNVPLLGSLFSRDQKTKSRTELAIFITPTLMEDSNQIATARLDSERRITEAGADLKPPPPPKGTERKQP